MIWCPFCKEYVNYAVNTTESTLEVISEFRCEKCHKTVEVKYYPK